MFQTDDMIQKGRPMRSAATTISGRLRDAVGVGSARADLPTRADIDGGRGRGRVDARSGGWQEKLFARAFHGLVYPQIWEDPAVDMAALEIGSHHDLVCIASGGCNVMSYLTARPRSITAVDLSPAHVALLRLKLAAARYLPDAESFARFFADGADRRNVAIWDGLLREKVDDETRAWWERRDAFGRRRITLFARGFYRSGLLGATIGACHAVARLHGVDLRAVTACRTLDEQRRVFDAQIAPLFDRRLMRWLTARRWSLFGLGIPPAQYEALAGPGGDMAAVLKARARKLACDFPIRENYFAWQAFARSYAPKGAGEDAGEGEGARPPYLEAQAFEALRDGADRVCVTNANIVERMRAMAAGSRHGYALLDAQDWMNDAQLNALWSEITRTAAPGARVVFRTAAADSVLPGRLDEALMSQWRYRKADSERLTAQDRAAIYGGVHLYEKRA